MHPNLQNRFQIFVQFPEFGHTKSLILGSISTETLRDLKLSLLSKYYPSLSPSSLYFALDGKPLSDETPVRSSLIDRFSTIVLRSRVYGGGGDGGATGAESRDCYLNMYAEKKPDKVDPHEQRLSKWLNCALSYEPLREPCVIDGLGNIFNKEKLVEALLEKKLPKEFGHIKGLKDMIKVQLSAVPGAESAGDKISVARFGCPITGFEFNGKYKFFALKSCGHVLSSKALKEVKSSSCLVCHEEFKETDKIVINGTEEEVMVLRERMEEEKAKMKEKKVKKVKSGMAGVCGEEAVDTEISRLSGRKHEIEVKACKKVSSKILVNGKASSVEIPVKGATDGAAKRFKASDMAPPNATKSVYASIFTSSRKSEFKETYSCRSLPLGRN